MRISTGYADTFVVLKEYKIIGKELCTSMGKMAKFRNVIVHQYEQIDPTIVVTILRKNLNDFERYKEAILAQLR